MKFTHIKKNKEIKMVDISKKKNVPREAKARALIRFSTQTFNKVISDESPKGTIFNTAAIAATMAAKKTHELIPLCHNINLSSINIDFKIIKKISAVEIISSVKSNTKTGVEMEALAACSIAALTIYDMCKSFDKKIIIEDLRLLLKSGGKSGIYKDDIIYPSY